MNTPPQKQREHRRKYPDKHREYGKKYREKNAEKLKERKKKYAAGHPVKKSKEASARYHRTHKFKSVGITQEIYYSILSEQGGKCAICKTSEWGYNGPAIDHDHKTGKARGLLCMKCNTGLGHFDDSFELLNTAIEYLKRYMG
jgi:hypothetical protein